MNWEECKWKGIVKETTMVGGEKIESLMNSSRKKLISCEQLVMNDDTASSKVSLIYDSLRIILEALAIKNGFKIYNHECITSFLKEELGEEKFSKIFDKYRDIRNNLNYYGEDVSIDDAKIMVDEIDGLREEILVKYFGSEDEIRFKK